jgi:hypothetical protein
VFFCIFMEALDVIVCHPFPTCNVRTVRAFIVFDFVMNCLYMFCESTFGCRAKFAAITLLVLYL